jgi:ABC-type nitrate/sulfonate/bicarbonate transport system ATPase subunit
MLLNMSNLFKPPFRVSVVGPSGCGKSHLMSDILTNPKYNMIRTKNNPNGYYNIDMVYVFSPTIDIDDS